MLIVFELLSTTVFFVLYALASVHRTTFLLNCLVATASVLAGILGVWRSTPAAVASFMVSIGSSFGFAVLGGLCLLSSSTVDLEVATLLDNFRAQHVVENREKLLNNAKLSLEIASAVLLANAIAHLSFSWALQQLVGERRAAIAFLQIFSVIMFPVSLFLILGGNYVVEMGSLTSAPYAGLAMFTIGVLLLLVALLAFIGGNFGYRRLLSLCYLISALSGTCLVVLAIVCYIKRSFVEDQLLTNWESVRLLLPPTSQIVYDRDRFAAVMRTNLNCVAYVGLLSGVFVLSEAAMSIKLMRHVSRWKQQVARAKHSMKDLQQTAITLDPVNSTTSVSPSEASLSVFQQWIKHFENSTKRQRIAMRIVIALILLGVLLLFAIMCANVILVAKCSNTGSQIASATFPLLNTSLNVPTNLIQLDNAFSHGEVIVLPTNATSGYVDLAFYSATGKSVEASDMYEKVTSNETVRINVRPLNATRFLWLDGSCQRSTMRIDVPQNISQRFVINSSTSVVMNAPETMRFQGLSVYTVKSSVLCSNLKIEGGELRVESTSGDLTVDRVTIDASNSSSFKAPVRISSALGLVTVSKVVLSQCDLQVITGASSLVLSNIHSSVNTGRSHIEATSSSASISVDDIHANWITLKNGIGGVYGTDILIEENSAFMGRLEVTTASGDIKLDNIVVSGSIRIESASGKITVQLNSQTFSGMYHMRSEYGTMSIRQTQFSSDIILEAADSGSTLDKRGSINCDAEKSNCVAFGSIYLHSNIGDIDLVLGCDSFSCS